jgi:GDP-L-fucose synthase
MKTILVTGGTGLVGSAIKTISQDYADKYNFIYLKSSDCNLINYGSTLDYFIEKKPDFVIHLAANVGGLFKNMENPVQMLEENLIINLNVIKASHFIKVEKLIACLSTCIFPDNITYPISEKDLHNGPPHTSNEGYAYSKRILQTLCNSYNNQYGDKFICVIPTNIYGPYDNFNLNDAHVIPALIHKCYLAKKNNVQFVVSGTGNPLRQFIYSEDLARNIMWVLEEYIEKEAIILSPNEADEISIGCVAKYIAKEFDYDAYLEFDTTKSDGQYKKTASNEKFRKYNPSFCFTKIEKGISDTISWFKQNYPNIRK